MSTRTRRAAPRGRPRITIDRRVVEGMALVGGRDTEIADYCQISTATLRRRCAEILRKARAQRTLRLRQLQWQSAESGNVTMQIWLGKNELGQRDQQEITGADGSPLMPTASPACA